MAEQLVEYQAIKKKATQTENEGLIQLRDLFFKCLSKWYWFVISLIICVGVAMLYILRTPPVYTRSTEIQIKSEGQGKSMPGGIQSFNDLGIFRTSTNVNNELKAFKSPDNMFEIVRRLHLDMNYSIDGHFHPHTLYGRQLPVVATIGGLGDEETAAFDIDLKGDKVALSDFVINGEKVKGEVVGKFNDSINTPIGNVYIASTDRYNTKSKSSYPTIHVRRSGIYPTSMSYLGKLGVGLDNKETDVITITCHDVSTQRAEDILNMLIVVYNESWVKDKNKITESTSEFINERLALIAQDLGDVDANIADIKSSNLTPDLEAAASLALSQSSAMNTQIMDVDNQLSMANFVRDFVKGASSQQIIPVTTGIGSTSIEAQITSYNQQVMARNELVAGTSENNTLAQSKEQTINALRESIIASLDNQILALNTQKNSLRKNERAATGKLSANPEQEKDLLSVARQQKVKESLYLFLLQKLEENELSQAFTAYNTRVIKHPSGGMAPTSPNRSQILLIAVILGLLIPLAIIYIMENMNTTIRGRQDLSDLTMPFLGEIPQAFVEKRRMPWEKEPEHNKKVVVVQQGKRDVINEAFRVVRTNLEFMTKEDQSNVIIFTSYNVNSGKTFTTMNMGIAIALKGKKVLLIDGDLRKASLSAYIDSPKVGLSNYLGGQFDNVNDAIIQHPEYETLFVLPVGTIPPNPTELISEARFGEAIAKLREQFDYILIDCPPIEILADTQIIEKEADRTLFVVRAGLMEKGLLVDLENVYQENKFKNMSLILNGTTDDGGRYGYHYGYRYGYGSRYGYHYGYGSRYGYGYAYGNQPKKKKKFGIF